MYLSNLMLAIPALVIALGVIVALSSGVDTAAMPCAIPAALGSLVVAVAVLRRGRKDGERLRKP